MNKREVWDYVLFAVIAYQLKHPEEKESIVSMSKQLDKIRNFDMEVSGE